MCSCCSSRYSFVLLPSVGVASCSMLSDIMHVRNQMPCGGKKWEVDRKFWGWYFQLVFHWWRENFEDDIFKGGASCENKTFSMKRLRVSSCLVTSASWQQLWTVPSVRVHVWKAAETDGGSLEPVEPPGGEGGTRRKSGCGSLCREKCGWFNTCWILLPVFCKNKPEKSDPPVMLVVDRKCVMWLLWWR